MSVDDTKDIVDAPLHDPKSDYLFSEGAYFPPQFRIVGFAIIIAGITLCFKLHLMGIVLLILGCIAVLAKKELSISFSLSKYRYAFVLLNYKFGPWESLPNFESISIFSAKKSQEMSAGRQSGTAVFSEIEVNLIYNKSRRLTVYTTQDFSKALNIARMFAEKFNLPIYDATKREGYWLD